MSFLTLDEIKAYEAALSGAASFVHHQAGYLKIKGEDRIAFLQRQTTNDINLLSSDGCLMTILTSPTGRILDVFMITGEADGLGVITLPGRGKQTASFLKNRIFFMDRVSIDHLSDSYLQVDLLGPQIRETLLRLSIDQIPDEGLFVKASINGNSLLIFQLPEEIGNGFRLIIPSSQTEQIFSLLTAVGIIPLSKQVYEVLRIEAGKPYADHELSEEFIPLEIGLDKAIASGKGCYTGQEVIARQINYDKITRKLVGLRFEHEAKPFSSVYADNTPAGVVTSIVESPRLGWIGLAVVKRPYHETGSSLKVGEVDNRVTVQVESLPFILPLTI